MTLTMETLLAARRYPGRVCVAAVTDDGVPVVAYAVSGRSAASRARRLAPLADGDIEVQDVSGGPPDALRHYTALARRGDRLVIGNGDQVIPIAEALAAGTTERDAWSEHTFEPDPPIWTPRIWMVSRSDSSELLVGWAQRSPGGHTARGLLATERIEPGHGLLISTYDGTADDVRASARPVDILTAHRDATALGDALWASLNPDLRVAAFTAAPADIRLYG